MELIILSEKKVCSKCKQEKPLVEFPIRQSRNKGINKHSFRNSKGYHSHCYECRRKITKNWYKRNRKQCWEYNLYYCYGITVNKWQELFEKQNGCCALCGKHQSASNKRLFVDHDHNTGRIRGLVCSHCNAGLAWYERKKGIIDKYIKEESTVERIAEKIRTFVE